MKLNKHLKFLTFEVKRSEFTDLQTSSIISHVYFYRVLSILLLFCAVSFCTLLLSFRLFCLKSFKTVDNSLMRIKCFQ